jgi:branched-chain amino acid transport system permease protein
MIEQAIADGLLSGAIIGLGAIGVSLGMQILRFANFSHSELLTWGAYIALTFTAFATAGTSIGPFSFGWQLLAAIALAGVGTASIALTVDTLVFRRLRNRRAQSVTMVFAAFGTGLILRNMVTLVWGTEAHYYTRKLQMAVEVLPGVRMLPDQMFVLGFSLVIVVALHIFLKYTRFGVAMRGVAESPSLAQVCGVRVDRIVLWTWVIGGSIAAAAGVFLGLTVQIRVEMGFNLLLALFTAAILGGTGSLLGAFVGGLTVGLIENLSVLFISPGYKQAMPFIVMLLVFYFRPQGLFGGSDRRTS